jgi:hypothetical protein
MMSKNFFVTNLAKAFEERTFDLDCLFLEGKSIHKKQFDTLLDSKYKEMDKN